MASASTNQISQVYAADQIDAFLGSDAATGIYHLEEHLASGKPVTNPPSPLQYHPEKTFTLPSNVLTAVQSGVNTVHVFSYGHLLMLVGGAMRLVMSEHDRRRLFVYAAETASFAEGTAIGNYLELAATNGQFTNGQPMDTILISDGSGLSGMSGNLTVGNSIANELMKLPHFKQQIVFFRDENSARDGMLKVIFNLLKMKLRTVGGLDNAVAEAKALGF